MKWIIWATTFGLKSLMLRTLSSFSDQLSDFNIFSRTSDLLAKMFLWQGKVWPPQTICKSEKSGFRQSLSMDCWQVSGSLRIGFILKQSGVDWKMVKLHSISRLPFGKNVSLLATSSLRVMTLANPQLYFGRNVSLWEHSENLDPELFRRQIENFISSFSLFLLMK